MLWHFGFLILNILQSRAKLIKKHIASNKFPGKWMETIIMIKYNVGSVFHSEFKVNDIICDCLNVF